MKIGKRNNGGNNGEPAVSGRAAVNSGKKTVLLIVVIVATALLIAYIVNISKKATDTVDVVVTSTSIYKNQQITADMIEVYNMSKLEYDKYSVVNDAGQTVRRVILWEERDKVLGYFAAFPIPQGQLLENRMLYKTKVDNSDSVMYSFPGKEIVSLDIANTDLTTFKTFLEPGDRININAIYKEDENVDTSTDEGYTKTEKVTTFRSNTVFRDIILADLLNSDGDSILDIYADYNTKSVGQQAALDNNETFQESVEPASILVALTPEEKSLYYYYLSKDNVEFRMSLPQRIQ